MSRDRGELSKRPERVIILDAEDPMTEIAGDFVWLEEHQRVVESVRREAYVVGYAAGQQSLDIEPTPSVVDVRRRRTWFGRLEVVLVVLAGLFVLLMLPVIFG